MVSVEQVRPLIAGAAESLNLLDSSGDLQPLDSLAAVTLLMEIEKRTGLRVAPSELRIELFESLDSVARLVAAHGGSNGQSG